MKTLNVSITDSERRKYHIHDDKIGFGELLDLVNRELMRQSLDKSTQLAERHGLSSMTWDEMNDEIAAVRNAKDHS